MENALLVEVSFLYWTSEGWSGYNRKIVSHLSNKPQESKALV